VQERQDRNKAAGSAGAPTYLPTYQPTSVLGGIVEETVLLLQKLLLLLLLLLLMLLHCSAGSSRGRRARVCADMGAGCSLSSRRRSSSSAPVGVSRWQRGEERQSRGYPAVLALILHIIPQRSEQRHKERRLNDILYNTRLENKTRNIERVHRYMKENGTKTNLWGIRHSEIVVEISGC
jgi:hypothetical protein